MIQGHLTIRLCGVLYSAELFFLLKCCYIVFLNRLLFGKGGSETMSTVQDPNRKPEEEISRLAEKYQLSLLRLCFAYLHDRTLAEDAVQETFLKAYRSISSFRNESSEKTWLSHIAINCCRDMNKSAYVVTILLLGRWSAGLFIIDHVALKTVLSESIRCIS